MSDFETSVKKARKLGYEGDKLREYVAKEQAVLRDERKAIREEQKEAREAELSAQKEQREF